ncbi:MAG: hypothetical protein ACYC7E_15235 [Armatimonadota bacterium]
MRSIIICLVLLVVVAAQGQGKRELIGWFGEGDPAVFVPKAAEIGTRALVVADPAKLAAYVAEGKKHGVDIYGLVCPLDSGAWKKRYPDAPIPWQVMNRQELDAYARMKKAPSNPLNPTSQEGGEPVEELEVLGNQILCFHDPRVEACLADALVMVLKVPGVRGVAFDVFGYQNYRCCRCPLSEKLFAEFQRQHPELSREVARDRFSLETLVGFINRLASHARQASPRARTMIHIYPVFLPEPLYGNRLDIDFCGQTAAWFFLPFWSNEKISAYSRIIARDARRYYRRPYGSALLGYYNMPDRYTVKSPEQVERELQAIFAGGCNSVMVCSLGNVLKTPETAAVFKRYFAPTSVR